MPPATCRVRFPRIPVTAGRTGQRQAGCRVGLHPVTIIIAVMAGTTLLGGLLGGILAIPFTAALRVLMSAKQLSQKRPPHFSACTFRIVSRCATRN